MKDESTPSVAEEERRLDQAILALVLDADESRPWSEHEVELEMGDHLATVDSLARLRGAGLIHRCGEFVFPARAAVIAERLLL
jgi:hypothetical protein